MPHTICDIGQFSASSTIEWMHYNIFLILFSDIYSQYCTWEEKTNGSAIYEEKCRWFTNKANIKWLMSQLYGPNSSIQLHTSISHSITWTPDSILKMNFIWSLLESLLQFQLVRILKKIHENFWGLSKNV